MAKHPKTVVTEYDHRPEDRVDPNLEVAPRLEPVPTDEPAARHAVGDPSRAILRAVLADAVAAFGRTASFATPDEAHTFAEAAHWFASDDASDPLSFVAICRTLGLDADRLREGLKSVRRRARQERVLH